jgi:hypothetical protein
MPTGSAIDKLSFEILDAINPKVLLFLDTSEYKDINPERPLLEVLPPGHAKFYTVNITAKKINVLNASLIGLTTTAALLNQGQNITFDDLPDGVWTLTYKVCPYQYSYIQRYHLRTSRLECKVRQIAQFLDFSDCITDATEKLKKDYVDITLLIEKGKAEAEEGCSEKASDAYQKANKRASRVLDCLNKKC